MANASVSVTAPDGTLIAMRLTDRSGKIQPISIPTPDREESLSPDPEELPFSLVNIYARIQGYEQVESENLQIFPDTVTDLTLNFIPLSELPGSWDQTQVFDTPAQNL